MDMEEEMCTTPKNQEYRIQTPLECPPAPKKKKNENRAAAKRYKKPKITAYFHSSDLDAFFGGDGARVLITSPAIQ
ncbi:hypothetical protein EJD97_021994 [Solanum chilense]|uniref:Uncharacterized protein n=1 Tax=Solanum chilense TaxID=4083 RepID=A0A6N2AUE7_SOLCI|nr:hypothetical protein EJD97_021994 [Solanum chilense]